MVFLYMPADNDDRPQRGTLVFSVKCRTIGTATFKADRQMKWHLLKTFQKCMSIQSPAFKVHQNTQLPFSSDIHLAPFK